MAAHRYWRASNLTPYGGASVELSEFWLLNGETRVDAPATLTSSIAPISGTLSSLRDNNTVTAASLARGTALTWDFGGSPADVTDIRVGSTLSTAAFLATAVLSWSDDGVAWTTGVFGSFVGIAWPGARSLTVSVDRNEWSAYSLLAMTKDPADGRIVNAPTNNSHSAKGDFATGLGVRQFEIERTSWLSNWHVGVWRVVQDVALSPTQGWAIRPANSQKGELSGTWTTYTTGTWSAADIFGCVIDFNSGSMTTYKNGVSLGVAFTSLAGEIVSPHIYAPAGTETATLRTNNFVYPIAGADPWTRSQIATTGPVSTPQSSIVPPATPQPARYDRVATPGPTRALANFFFDPNARGRIIGTVKRKGTPDNVPLARRVRLYRDVDGLLVAETWSNAAGDFVFENIEENVSYTTIAYDYEHNYRAIAADNLNLANGAVELMR